MRGMRRRRSSELGTASSHTSRIAAAVTRNLVQTRSPRTRPFATNHKKKAAKKTAAIHPETGGLDITISEKPSHVARLCRLCSPRDPEGRAVMTANPSSNAPG
jgi:hypothetical protein